MPIGISRMQPPLILNDFRLTLTSGTPVTTSDVTNASTIYCSPFSGNLISLYDGSNWVTYSSNEFSLALGTLTNATPYDVFCYSNSGVPTLEFLAWTNTTTRATNLVYQDGILCKSGALTRRYLGTFFNAGNKTSTVTISNATPGVVTWNSHGLYANAPVVFTTTGTLPTGLSPNTTYYVSVVSGMTANTFSVSATPGGASIATSSAGSGVHTATVSTYVEDSLANRFIWNYYNAVPRQMYYKVQANFNYTVNAHQIWNADLNAKLNFIIGVAGLPSSFLAIINRSNSTVSIPNFITIGNNSITTPAADYTTHTYAQGAVNCIFGTTSAYTSQFSVGLNFVAPLQSSTATGTCTWYAAGGKFEGIVLG